MSDCQKCLDPCFRFYEIMGVCPKEIGLNSNEEAEAYLQECSYQDSQVAFTLLDSSDCCPMFEK